MMGKWIQEFIGKPEGNRLLGRPKCRWEDNIKVYHKEHGGRVWIEFI
jgi:hypothetical protein